MNIKIVVDRELRRQGKTFKWLVEKVGISNNGLKSGLENDSIRFGDLKKLLQVLKMPITMLFEGDTTYQSIAGDNNTQASHSFIAGEPPLEYKRENDRLKEQVEQLKNQLNDKDMIIQLLKSK